MLPYLPIIAPVPKKVNKKLKNANNFFLKFTLRDNLMNVFSTSS